MFILMVIVFVLGYIAIALEHPLKIDKAASALLIGTLTWTIYILGIPDILELGFSNGWHHFLESSAMQDFLVSKPDASNLDKMLYFIGHHETYHYLAHTSTILFFLLGAMTIVEIVDQHQGFKIITDKIKTTNRIKLLWILSILAFFMSAVLDNLTTSIVMVALMRKLVANKKERWFMVSMIVLSANAGGAWSPIGDITTIMLWIGGQVTTFRIIIDLFLPSLTTMLVPLIIITLFYPKGKVERPELSKVDSIEYTTNKERIIILVMGVSALLFVPVFKTFTYLEPFLGMLFGLSIMWITTELMHKMKEGEDKRRLTVVGILRKVDVPTVLFFLGILTAVASLSSAGHLDLLAGYLDEKLGNIYAINLIIGMLSAIVDNVPLVAGAMGMYDITGVEAIGYSANFVQDGHFWQFLAYCAGTGGSILIIGSAAGVAAMGMERIDFIWYMKKISLLAFAGYIAGAAVYYFQSIL